jgi:hypothetical protein
VRKYDLRSDSEDMDGFHDDEVVCSSMDDEDDDELR